MKYPNLWHVENLIRHCKQHEAMIDGEWVPARCLGYPSFLNRFKRAWLVFTGKADAVLWRGQ